jgi:hypothetical protein
VIIGGSGSNTLTLSGTLTQINDLLAGNGGATLSFINGGVKTMLDAIKGTS